MPKPSKTPAAQSKPTPRAYRATAITPCTLRLPSDVLARLDARVIDLNAKGEGKWSRNSLVASILIKTTGEWDR